MDVIGDHYSRVDDYGSGCQPVLSFIPIQLYHHFVEWMATQLFWTGVILDYLLQAHPDIATAV